MHPVHDVDALLLLTMTLSCKRRPAELVEIVAAADLLQLSIPLAAKLGEAFFRLSTHGLIGEVDGRYTLTADAQTFVADLPRKAESAERLFAIKEQLSAYEPKGEYTPVVLSVEQIDSAQLAHKTAAATAAKNLLVAKPKASESAGKPGGVRRRKPLPARRRKD